MCPFCRRSISKCICPLKPSEVAAMQVSVIGRGVSLTGLHELLMLRYR